ncbi:hypothetical protein KCU92_g151, partial [Aureobasidium melanogenum]
MPHGGERGHGPVIQLYGEVDLEHLPLSPLLNANSRKAFSCQRSYYLVDQGWIEPSVLNSHCVCNKEIVRISANSIVSTESLFERRLHGQTHAQTATVHFEDLHHLNALG